jgi:O-methyltransferase
MVSMIGVRMKLREIFLRTGFGPLRRPAALIEGYSRFRDWSNDHPCDKVFGDRFQPYSHINEALGTGPIDYLEFGVYRGASIGEWSRLNRHPISRFYGFDSFEGLPEQWNGGVLGRDSMARGSFDVSGQVPVIDDRRVEFIKGYFQDSLPTWLGHFQPKNQLVIHMDADLYTSTLYVLCGLDRLIVPGTVIIFDEFAAVNDEFQALVDYTSSFRRTYRLLAYTKPNRHQVAISITDLRSSAGERVETG